MADAVKPATLAPPAVRALKEEAAANSMLRVSMERTVSEDMRNEREDLKEAAEHSLNVIMDLGLDGKIRYVSESWKDVVGTNPEDVVGKPVSELVLGNPNQFAETVESIKADDSRSHITRFSMRMGPASILGRKRSRHADDDEPESAPETPVDTDEERVVNLEAQGIMVYDRTTGTESHVRTSHAREDEEQEEEANVTRPCG
jgi:serine/threonine-protein kinase RIM15